MATLLHVIRLLETSSAMDLCDFCEHVVRSISERFEQHAKRSEHTKTTKLSASATACRLCKMIQDFLTARHAGSNLAGISIWELPQRYSLTRYRDPEFGISSATLFNKDLEYRPLCMEVWADDGEMYRNRTLRELSYFSAR